MAGLDKLIRAEVLEDRSGLYVVIASMTSEENNTLLLLEFGGGNKTSIK